MVSIFDWLKGKKAYEPQRQQEFKITPSITSNTKHLSELFEGIPEFVCKELVLKNKNKAAIAYIDGLIDKVIINRDIIRPLLYEEWDDQHLFESAVSMGTVKKNRNWREIEQAILSGKTVLFVDGISYVLVLETQGWPQRSIKEPQVETSVKSAHQGFTETANQNIAMIRRYIPSTELKVKTCTVGKRGQVNISILYIADVVNKNALQEVEKRVKKINVDTILNTGELEGFIEDDPYTPFPQLSMTERPDTAASHLLQGRVAIIVDRSPGVLVGPMTFTSFFQTTDDYSIRWLVSSFVRMLRFVGAIIAIFAPALYIALISFHYEVIPLRLLLSIAESRERVPLPPLIEALIMELVLEMLREAGIRLPSPIGQTIGVVGGIVIGQAAVQAGIVSNIMVIVVAMTAISSFILPNLELGAGIRLIRFPLMLLASAFGMVGIVAGIMTLVIHLLALESLGMPYSAPISPLRLSDMKDTFVRLPVWLQKKRPESVGPQQLKKQDMKIRREEEAE
ncbi:spore germination protein KA [Paenibacillus larvae subsp. larvae]|uniref:Spore germination protein n=2 Tax=Paenibacillus larvae TaxID=1464 RepID=A0A1U9YQV6_9BACL|nr:spore germination protein [Paenibacillus larvae]AQT86132.1 spore germination protein [Paenibacillus larvae subsp. pulvifaciens]AQZ47742.1 spore germination protein [Paenibacillus larvae subsp. pulvifaciens]ARF69445.1 spore germination protein [Paenibacillus larvae subsp. pulvifaciens]AVF25619.1 spore germination protein KA [Paenibacillus larvae subsp. larvae]AVF30396.1 spore germination protein KA [Paenibacillus larvae subsp. larvae]